MKRIFIAIRTGASPELTRMITTLRSLLATEKIKWVDPGNTHLTLCFLGDTEEQRIRKVAEILKESCTGFGTFGFLLAGTGIFKTWRDPRIIWVGIREAERLAVLNNVITRRLIDSGFEVEDRPFKPHLTIGRIRSLINTGNLKTLVERYSESEFQKVEAKEVILYESILQQSGPVYDPLGKFSLQ